MPRRQEETSAGGLVVRRSAGGFEALIAEQLDRNSGRRTVRLPKGRVDAGETLEQAALREVREEVGLVARILAPLGVTAYSFFERRAGHVIAKRVHYYLMAHERGEAAPADGEMDAVAWLAIAEAERRMTFEGEREIVARGRALLESADPRASDLTSKDPRKRDVVQSVFSPSSLNCYENCPKQYSFRYIEKIESDSEGVEAFVGKRVHEILERLYRFVADGMLPSLEKVVARYRANFDERYDAARVRIAREGTELGFYRDAGARGLENYYRRHYPFDLDQTVGLEKPIQFALDEDGKYAVRGIIDRLARAKDGVLEIQDFKTARRIPKQDDLDRDRQLGLYELAIREQLGEEGEIRLVWHYVLRDERRVSQRTPEQREKLRADTARAIDRIRGDREFAPRPSALCGWCEFRERCPAVNPEGARAALEAAAAADPQLLLL